MMPLQKTQLQVDDIKIGMRVRHQKFGTGTITAIGFHKSLPIVIVKFDDPSVGKKYLVLDIAPLELLSNHFNEKVLFGDDILNDQKACLRIIQALKAGRAPREGIHFLSVGIDGIISRLQQAFQKASQHKPQILWLIGDYGEGKSHILRLVVTLAEKNGFAWAYIVHDKEQLIGLHKPSKLFWRLLFELQWSNPKLHLDFAFEKEEEIRQEIFKDFQRNYPTSWKERAEYWYDRNMRRELVERLSSLATNLVNFGYCGLVICLDEFENCCQLHWNQHNPAYETLYSIKSELEGPVFLLFAITSSGFEELKDCWIRHVGREACNLLDSMKKKSIITPPLQKSFSFSLTERIYRLHAVAFGWQPTVNVQDIYEKAWNDAENTQSGRWRTFVQSVVTRLEIVHQSTNIT